MEKTDAQTTAAKNGPADTTAAEQPALPDNVVVLDEPIVRGNTTITQVELRKPMSGELRGVTLSDILNLDVNALRKVLPRITTPTLTDIEVGRMDPADLLEIGGKVASFLLRKSVKAEAFLSA